MGEVLTTEEADAFSELCRKFLAEHATAPAESVAEAKTFLGAAADAGFGGLVYDAAYGGAGRTAEHDKIWRAEKANFQAMDRDFVISHGICLPMMNDFGTEEQKTEFMPALIRGETMWCQMFSEPNAGSDVASLRTSAILDGDQWIINGQKVWTTLAHESDYGVIIARTDPHVPKHAGISMFIVDMNAPGVEIRPIHQIDGGTHFNEVFFTDVAIPKAWLLGEQNNGWNQATAMLMYERVAIGSIGGGDITQPYFDRLVESARDSGSIDNAVVRDQLMELYSMETTKSIVAMRVRAEMQSGKAPGPGGSLGKLAGSTSAWKFREIAASIHGMESIAWDEGDETRSLGEHVGHDTVSSFQVGIAGGTDEIQRNIIGERVLGLPRPPAVDRGVPFNELD